MILKEHVKERINRVIELTTAQADHEIMKGEKEMGDGQVSYAATGFATGVQFVRDIILAEFDFLYHDDVSPGDEPVEPFYYIDSNKILFRDAHYRFFFWDELYQHAYGPYGNSAKACEALREYGGELDGVVGVKKNHPKSRGGMVGEVE